MGCSSTSGSSLRWFEEDGILYGTAAAGTNWAPCGSCYELEIMPDCASIHGGYGCDANRNRAILGSGRQAFIVALNLCPECKKGHFDLCQDGNWGGTVLGSGGGVDNPALMYREVGCPPALMKKLGCGSASKLKSGSDPSGTGSGPSPPPGPAPEEETPGEFNPYGPYAPDPASPEPSPSPNPSQPASKTSNQTETDSLSSSSDSGSVLRNVVIFVLGLIIILFICCIARAVDEARKQAQGASGVATTLAQKLGLEKTSTPDGRNMIAVNLGRELKSPIAESVAVVQGAGNAVLHPIDTTQAAGQDIHFVVTGRA